MFSFALVIPLLFKNTPIHHKKYYNWNRESESRTGIDIEHFIGIGIGIGIEVNFGIVPSLAKNIHPRSFGHKIFVFDFRKLKFSRFVIKILSIKSYLLNWHETVFYLLSNNICPCVILPLDFETPGAELCTGKNLQNFVIC